MSPVFTKHDDGCVTIDQFPLEIEVDEVFLAQCDPKYVRLVHPYRLAIDVANGYALYDRRAYNSNVFDRAYVRGMTS